MQNKTPKSLLGLDEFTSFRVRKGALEQTPLDLELGLSFEDSKKRELMVLGSTDPYLVAKGTHKDEPSAESEFSHMLYKNALIQSRLEQLQDYNKGMSAQEVHAFFQRAGFDLAYAEGKQGTFDRHEIWAQEKTGVVITGAAPKPGLHDFHIFFQWSPNLDRMNEDQETNVSNRLQRIFGFGNIGYGLLNPLRPLLSTSTLHYPYSYPELTEEEAAQWKKDYNASPAWIDQERGKWIYVVHAMPTLGILTPLDTLEQMQGQFISPWKSGCVAQIDAHHCLGKNKDQDTFDRVWNNSAPWFKRMVGDALVEPERAEALLLARKKIQVVPSCALKPA